MESKFLEVEVLSYNKPGQPPRPVSFRFMMGEEMFKGKVVKVKDMKLDNRMGNKILIEVSKVNSPHRYIAVG